MNEGDDDTGYDDDDNDTAYDVNPNDSGAEHDDAECSGENRVRNVPWGQMDRQIWDGLTAPAQEEADCQRTDVGNEPECNVRLAAQREAIVIALQLSLVHCTKCRAQIAPWPLLVQSIGWQEGLPEA